MDLDYVRFLLALLFVIGLIGALALLARRFGLGAVRVSAPFRRKDQDVDRRLAVVEATSLDARRRLVLVRRDNVEHLILLGANSDLLIESDISPARRQPREAPEQVADGVSGGFARALQKARDPRG